MLNIQFVDFPICFSEAFYWGDFKYSNLQIIDALMC